MAYRYTQLPNETVSCIHLPKNKIKKRPSQTSNLALQSIGRIYKEDQIGLCYNLRAVPPPLYILQRKCGL